MQPTIRNFLDLLSSQVARAVYVWGGNGQDLNAMSDPIAWIERREEDPENEKRDIALYEKLKKDGVNPIQAFDCSGLVYWALHTLGLQETDLSSRGFYSLCKHIEEKDLRVGDLVFHHDGTQIVHVGVCVGEEQIECRGRDVGVVKNKRKAGYWNRFGRLPCFENEPEPSHEPPAPDPDPEPTPEPPKPEPPKPTPAIKIKVKGSVRVREGNGVLTKKIKTVRNCLMPYCGQAIESPYWYMTEVDGKEGYISSKPKLTELVEVYE